MTESDQRVLRFIHDYRRTNGISPSMRDVAAACGWSSPNAAQSHVVSLIESGHLARAAGSGVVRIVSRGYRLSATGLAALADLDPSTGPTTCPECGQPTAGGAP